MKMNRDERLQDTIRVYQENVMANCKRIESAVCKGIATLDKKIEEIFNIKEERKMEIKKGKIVEYRVSENDMPALKLDDNNWYISNDHTKTYVSPMKERIGSKVQLSVEGNIINFIKRIDPDPPLFEINGAVVGLAVKAANIKVLQDQTKTDSESLKPMDWAVLVREHTQALLSEIKILHEGGKNNA